MYRIIIKISFALITFSGLSQAKNIDRPFESNDINYTAKPGWVIEIDYGKPSLDFGGGEEYLLVDRQTSTLNSRQRFYHYAKKLHSQRAVETNGQLALSFAPDHQSLNVHYINVVRNGEVIDKINRQTLRLISAEPEAERLIYNGRIDATFFIEDLRKGDIIDYAYTLNGSNPALKDHFYQYAQTQWGVEVKKVSYRVLWPKEHALYSTLVNTDSKPKIIEAEDHLDYRIYAENTQALDYEDEIPNWYYPEPRVVFSSVKNWQQVVTWATPFYQINETDLQATQNTIDRIKAQSDTKAEQLAAALQYVQSEIRYLGIELGKAGFIPTSPRETIARRYGDCKDKTLLLLHLLHGLEIEANAALVNTKSGQSLKEDGARVLAFDHVIVHAKLNDKDYWLDGTRSDQIGPIDHIYQPDFGWALDLKNQTRNLTLMLSDNSKHRQHYEEMIDLRNGIGNPAKYQVTTVHEGLFAERQRRRWEDQSANEIQRDYIKYYENFFSDFQTQKRLIKSDVYKKNILTTEEEYEVLDFWNIDKGDEQQSAIFYSYPLYSYLEKPRSKRRQSPYQLQYPANVSQKITVMLPEAWTINDTKKLIENDYFKYSSSVKYDEKENRIIIQTEYEAKRHFVPSKDFKTYYKDLLSARDDLDFYIFQTKKTEAISQNTIKERAAILTTLSNALLKSAD